MAISDNQSLLILVLEAAAVARTSVPPADRSRAPHRPGHGVSEEMAATIVALHHRYPWWWPRKLERAAPGMALRPVMH